MAKAFHLLKKILLNRYLLALVAFAVWMSFFDKNDLITQRERRTELNVLQEKISYYNQQIEESQKQLQALQSDPETIEKTAREKYLMKRENEEIFVMEAHP